MDDLLTADKLGLFLYLCAPGVVISFVRATFLTGRMPSGSEGVLSYVTLSLLYQAALLPLTHLKMQQITSNQLPTGTWALLIFVLPALVGALLGLNAREQWARRLLRKLRINPVHPLETAWDWRFGKCAECYVIVTMKNEIKWYGFLGEQSFMSSSPKERDLFLERTYDLGSDKKWSERGSGVWLSGGEIQSIEQWPKRRK
jgi:hypothetical protein